jgi:uncharacterized protein YgbK (DUF1537 family)
MNNQNISILTNYIEVDQNAINQKLDALLKKFDKKIIVLDDDPTGVQTVHDISVYTDWDVESIKKGFDENNNMFFILTNSRGLTSDETKKLHEKITENIIKVSDHTGKDFMIISRSDSTLRGHYPLETEVLKSVIEKNTSKHIDGEIIIPFFMEGGRYTIDDIHYVQEGNDLVPAGHTEFAKDKTFGYKASHLGEWCEEKSRGKFKKEDTVYISIEEIRSLDIDEIVNKLEGVTNFNKIIVNAVDYVDVKIFSIALIKALLKGKNFLIRSAAAITKVLGNVPDKELLSHNELIRTENNNGGIIIVGSHVQKTTLQLEELKTSKNEIYFVEFNQHRVLEENGLEDEVQKIVNITNDKIESGITVAIYTRRERFDLDTDDKEEQLKISIKISDAVTSIVSKLSVRPNFIIAKGGITSSDIGTKALQVKKATVMGQIMPGIPVWMTGEESKFPGLPYIIFPGNVGTKDTLKDAVEVLINK